MSVALTGSGGLFTILGRIFHAQETINTARGTTVDAEVVDVITQFENLTETIEVQEVVEGLTAAFIAWRDDETIMSQLSTIASDLIVKLVNDDNRQEDQSLRTAMLELIDQMEGSGGESNPDNDVDASTAAVSVAAGGSNNTDGVVVASATNGDGRNCENALAEDIEVTVASNNGSGTLRCRGEYAEGDRLSSQWPKGSGSSATLSGVTGDSGNLLANGGMDDEDDRTNTPDDWDLVTTPHSNIGTTILMSDYEVQTVAISGTPTSGTYTLHYTDVDSDVQYTEPLAYNASGSAVQTALRKLQGLENVTVSTSGTTPNFTHTVTFAEMDPPGNVGNLASDETFDTGSIAHAQSTAGTAHVYKDKAVIFDSNGSELTQLRQRLTNLSPRTVYACNAWMKVDAYPAAGVVTIDLVDGGGTVIQNAQATNNSFTIDPTSGGDLSTSAFSAVNGFFQTPAVLPEVVYLRIRISTAISDTASLYIDEVSLVAATELYASGPYAAFFAGQTKLSLDDTWTITVTNDRAGEYQEWFFRNFGFTDLLLPSDSGGSETISDTTLIS